MGKVVKIKNKDEIIGFDIDKYDQESHLDTMEWLCHFMLRETTEKLLSVMPIHHIDAWKQQFQKDILDEPIQLSDGEIEQLDEPLEPNSSKKHDFQLHDIEFHQSLPPTKELSVCDLVEYMTFVNSCVEHARKEMQVTDLKGSDALEKFIHNAKIKRAREAIEILDVKQARLLVDLRYSDTQIIEEFKEWLTQKRVEIDDKKQGKPLLIDKAKRINYRILAYYDLLLWQKAHKKTITKQFLVDLLYPNQGHSRDYIGKTIHPLFQQIKKEFKENAYKRFMDYDDLKSENFIG